MISDSDFIMLMLAEEIYASGDDGDDADWDDEWDDYTHETFTVSWKGITANIRTDKKLTDMVKEGETYLAPDLNDMFTDWYNTKLKTVVYPQYKNFEAVSKGAIKEKPKGDAYSELMEMVGLKEAKAVIQKAKTY